MADNKILFIEPPPPGGKTPERSAGCSYELYHLPDLANLYIFTILHQNGFRVDYLDCVSEKLAKRRFWEEIEKLNPDYCVIHSVILSKEADLSLIRKLSVFGRKRKILVYGPEPTRAPEDYLVSPEVLVFRGEADETIPDYLAKGALSGTSFIERGVISHAPPSGSLIDPDKLPIPYRDHRAFLPYLKKYFNPKFKKSPFATMMTSRGCSFNCVFCVPISINFAREIEYKRYHGVKPPLRKAGAERVIKEFCEVKRQGFNSVMVLDDQFLWEEERTLRICEGVKRLGLEWGCLSRADFLTERRIIEKLAEAGCSSIDIGVESLNQKALDYINKRLSVDTIMKAVSLLNEHGIEPKLNIMLGCCPGESARDIMATIRRLKEMRVKNIMFSIATPFKGTDFYELCRKEGYLIRGAEKIDPLSRSIISYPALSNKSLERLQRYAYRSFYLRWGIIKERIKRYGGIGDFIRDAGVAVKLFRRR